MAGNRKGFEEFVLKFMGKVTAGGGNRTIYKNIFSVMTDDDVEKLVVFLENGGALPIYSPNNVPEEMIDFDNIIAVCEEYGVSVEQQLVLIDDDTGLEFTTPETFYIGTTEVRKQRQMWVKKFSGAKDDSNIEDLTGQVVGESRATGLTAPEQQVLKYLGLPVLSQELYDVRGGDAGALDSYRNDLIQTGRTSTTQSLKNGSGVKVLSLVHYLFMGRHISNNLDQR